MGNQHMETSHNKAWKCEHLHMYFLLFQLKKNIKDILKIHESLTHGWASTELNGAQPPFTQVRNHRKIWKYVSGD